MMMMKWDDDDVDGDDDKDVNVDDDGDDGGSNDDDDNAIDDGDDNDDDSDVDEMMTIKKPLVWTRVSKVSFRSHLSININIRL